MDAPDQVKLLNPWITIWTRPRETIRRIVESDPTKNVLLIVALSSLGQGLAEVISEESIPSIPVKLLIALIVVPILGILFLYLFGALLSWSGGLFGGWATSEEVRAAIAWSEVPLMVAAFLFTIPGSALLESGLFASPAANERPLLPLALLALLVLIYVPATILNIWSFVLFLKCVGEVHGFSAWKALGAWLVASLVLAVFVFLPGALILSSAGLV